MMREIVNHSYAALDATNFDAPFHRFESSKRFLNLYLRNTPAVCRNDDSQAISHIKFADQIRFKFAPAISVFENRKARYVARKINITRLPFGIVRSPESFNVRVKPAVHFVENFAGNRRINTDNQTPV